MCEIDRLLGVMAALRDPATGCPWDIVQTPATIAPYTIEEAYEVADAIAREAWDELRGELGDLLLQVVYHARMAEEAGRFDFDDVARAIADKMVARHPHVFGAADRDKTPARQSADWEAAKAAERGDAGVLAGVAQGLPALLRALKLQRRAARVGFDWPSVDGPLGKVAEEVAELRAETDPDRQAAEFGDLLFAMVNVARHMGIDPEAALRGANARFTRRFERVEDGLAAQGRRPQEADPAEMDALWDAAKADGL